MRPQTSTGRRGWVTLASREERCDCGEWRVGVEGEGMVAMTWSSSEMGGICGSCETSEVNETELIL